MQIDVRAVLLAALVALVLIVFWYYSQNERDYAATGFAFDGSAGLFSVGIPAGQKYVVGAMCRLSRVVPTGASSDDHKAIVSTFEGCKGLVCGMSKSLCTTSSAPAVVLKVPAHFNSFCLPHGTLVLTVKRHKIPSWVPGSARCPPPSKDNFLQKCDAVHPNAQAEAQALAYMGHRFM